AAIVAPASAARFQSAKSNCLLSMPRATARCTFGAKDESWAGAWTRTVNGYRSAGGISCRKDGWGQGATRGDGPKRPPYRALALDRMQNRPNQLPDCRLNTKRQDSRRLSRNVAKGN